MGLFDLFFKKNNILRAVCVFCLVPPACVRVSLNHSGGLSSGIFKFAHMVKFIFTLAFGP